MRSLMELLDDEADNKPAPTPEPEQTETPEAQVEKTQVEEAPVGEDQPEPEVVEEPEAEADSDNDVIDLRQILQEDNHNIDGLTRDEIIKIARERLRGQTAPEPPPIPEDPSDPKDETKPNNQDTPEQTEAKEQTRKIARLTSQPELREYVTFNEAGRAVAKDEFGEAGIKAASKLNEYLDARRLRVQNMIDDPLGFLGEDLESIIDDRVSEKLAKLQEKQEAEKQAQQAQLEMMTEEERTQSLLNEYNKELYQTDEKGELKIPFGSSQPMLSEFGETFRREYDSLVSFAPNAPVSKLLQEAYRITKQQVESRAPAPEPTPKEKKKKFLDRRNQEPPRAATDPRPASPQEVADVGGKVSLLEAMLADEANQDNPELAELRKS